jgi:hypothetical protein
MKISLAITVCNELKEIQKLLPFLINNKREEDQIIILYDSKNGSKSVEDYLRANSVETYASFAWHPYEFDGHFANMKNHLTNLCDGDYIYQIDADEMVDQYILAALPQLLEANDIDVLRVPRINTVSGLTQEHINKWGWRVDTKGWVNFPDYQWRIYRNNAKIKWVNKVHEVLTGYETHADLPPNKEWCLLHPKDIERQEKQNSYYETLQ